MVKIWNNKRMAINWQGLAGTKLEKEAVVPKEIEHLRRTGRSYRPAGPLLRTDMANWGFLSY